MTAVWLALALMVTAPKLSVSGDAVLAVWPDGYHMFAKGESLTGLIQKDRSIKILDAAPGRPGHFFALFEQEGALHVVRMSAGQKSPEALKLPPGFRPDSLLGLTNGQLLLQDSRTGQAQSTDGETWTEERSNRIPVTGVTVGQNLMNLMPDEDWKKNGLSITVQARDGVAGVLYSMRPVRAWMVEPSELPKGAVRPIGIVEGWSDLAPVAFEDADGSVLVAFYNEEGKLKRVVSMPDEVSRRDVKSMVLLANGALWIGREDGRIEPHG
ncbi:MAG: hypothetical protein KF884_09460 [Fimbriimonadaceae bacterium]|nr:hypothetical protein [Fimbriimonadaceae bacterium]QYK57773.1 MAG: hypothetical protein KF884_09460 [Fimbriimonadaceae bacterium]